MARMLVSIYFIVPEGLTPVKYDDLGERRKSRDTGGMMLPANEKPALIRVSRGMDRRASGANVALDRLFLAPHKLRKDFA